MDLHGIHCERFGFLGFRLGVRLSGLGFGGGLLHFGWFIGLAFVGLGFGVGFRVVISVIWCGWLLLVWMGFA